MCQNVPDFRVACQSEVSVPVKIRRYQVGILDTGNRGGLGWPKNWRSWESCRLSGWSSAKRERVQEKKQNARVLFYLFQLTLRHTGAASVSGLPAANSN